MQVANISCNKDSSMAVKILMVKSLFNLPEVSPPLYTLKTCQYLYVTLVNITGQTCSLALLHTTCMQTHTRRQTQTDSKQQTGSGSDVEAGAVNKLDEDAVYTIYKGIFEHDIV